MFLGYTYGVSAVEEDLQPCLPFRWDEKGPSRWDEKGLERRLSFLAGRPVSISITSNSVSVLSMRRSSGGTFLRLHGVFLNAGQEVVSEIARFIKNGKKGERFPVLSRYIRENRRKIESSSARQARGRKEGLPPKTAGRFHDLRRAYDCINREYFGGELVCDIGWGRSQRRHAVKKRTLGSYCPPANEGGRGLIRINPVLDRKAVPSYYLRFVVYHEMLHARLGIALKNGRRSMHSPEFRRLERLFREYREAMAWESGRAGRP